MKKTPIQKLIDKLDGFVREADSTGFTEDKYYRYGLREAIEEAESLLEEEREQLIQAVCIEELITARQDAEKWFERTYESND